MASIVFAAQVDGKVAAGDWAGALESSRKAKAFATWAAAVAVFLVAAYLLFFFVMMLMSVFATTTTSTLS